MSALSMNSRDCSELYCHHETLQCVLKNNCIPCMYKLFPVGKIDKTDLKLPCNTRPELCPRDYRNSKYKQSVDNTNSIDEFKSSLPWYNNKNILTVGDGDFSYSLSLLTVHKPKMLVATSYESNSSVLKTYKESTDILKKLHEEPNVHVFHDVDAKNLTKCAELRPFLHQFDYIIWNFPCVRHPKGADAQASEMLENQNMLVAFFAECEQYLVKKTESSGGYVHITHKTFEPFCWWDIRGIGERSGSYTYTGSLLFDRCLFPGYINRKALDKKSFPLHDAQVFEFAHNKSADKNGTSSTGSPYPSGESRGAGHLDFCRCNTHPNVLFNMDADDIIGVMTGYGNKNNIWVENSVSSSTSLAHPLPTRKEQVVMKKRKLDKTDNKQIVESC